MKITRQQFLQIHSAILDGYDRPGLRRMLRLGLDSSLDDITAGTPDSQVVFDVIEWAERTDNVLALIDAAVEHNPQNELLQQLKREAATWHTPREPAPAAAAHASAAATVIPSASPPASAPSAGGDIITATIGAGAQDIVVGKNIQKSSGDSRARKEP